MKTNFSLNLILLIILLLALAILSMSLGGSSVGLAEFTKWLFNPSTLDSETNYILSELRFPRTMTCLLVGASLGLSGALLQTLLKNPLAEPYTLGLSGGASLGAALAILLKLQPNWLIIPLASLAGCFIVTLIILNLAWRYSRLSQRTLILAGIMISLFCGSMVVLLMTYFDPHQIQTSFYWMLGQVGSERDQWWPYLFFILAPSLLWCFKNVTHLDRLLLGADVAQSLGTNSRRLQKIIIVLTALLCSASVSIVGLIGFVGLLSPHLALLLFTQRHRWYLIASCLGGGFFLLTADILGRFLGGEREIPAGGLVALFGAPLLIFLLIRWERHAHS